MSKAGVVLHHALGVNEAHYFALANDAHLDVITGSENAFDPSLKVNGYLFYELAMVYCARLAYILGRDEAGLFRGSVSLANVEPELPGFDITNAASGERWKRDRSCLVVFPLAMHDLMICCRVDTVPFQFKVGACKIELTQGKLGWTIESAPPNLAKIAGEICDELSIELEWDSAPLARFIEDCDVRSFDW